MAHTQPPMAVRVTLPFTCGELVQGRIDEVDFHVTCPIRRCGSIEAWWGNGGAESKLLPKARQAAGRALDGVVSPDRRSQLRFRRHVGAPSGKGFATSSVDVLGVIAAVRRLLGYEVNAAEISRMAVAVEPTDGIAFPGISLFDHLHGKCQRFIGKSIPLGIVVLEPRETIDTVEFNRSGPISELIQREGLAVWRDALAMLDAGLKTGDEPQVAAAATTSALFWQRVLHNPWLEPALAWGLRKGALGVCRAHSGTALGVLYGSRRDLRAPTLSLRELLPATVCVWSTQLSDGGLQ